MTMPRIASAALLLLAVTAARAGETLPDAIQAPGQTRLYVNDHVLR